MEVSGQHVAVIDESFVKVKSFWRAWQTEGYCAIRFLRGNNTDAGRLAEVNEEREDHARQTFGGSGGWLMLGCRGVLFS
jgi:hypothetical protein